MADIWPLTSLMATVKLLFLTLNFMNKIQYTNFIVTISVKKTVLENKPKGLKVAKEELRSIGLMVDRLDGQ